MLISCPQLAPDFRKLILSGILEILPKFLLYLLWVSQITFQVLKQCPCFRLAMRDCEK